MGGIDASRGSHSGTLHTARGLSCSWASGGTQIKVAPRTNTGQRRLKKAKDSNVAVEHSISRN